MSPNNGGIDEVQVPIDLAAGICLRLQGGEETLPQTGLALAIEPT
jgi:hypothetical protein